jgi:hypothetical protein
VILWFNVPRDEEINDQEGLLEWRDTQKYPQTVWSHLGAFF